MSRLTATITRGDQNLRAIEQFGRFRKKLFIDTLGWPLRSFRGEEIDDFDGDDAIYCVVRFVDEVVAGFRAMPTDGQYMARSAFPTLASERPYPQAADIWEISRFGIVPGAGHDIAQINYGLMFRLAQRRQVKALVAIADLTYERYLAALGVRTVRYGPPQPLARTRAGQLQDIVAGEIPVLEQSGTRFRNLLAMTNSLEIIDETLVLGSESIPA